MMAKGECPPLMVVFDPVEGYVKFYICVNCYCVNSIMYIWIPKLGNVVLFMAGLLYRLIDL